MPHSKTAERTALERRLTELDDETTERVDLLNEIAETSWFLDDDPKLFESAGDALPLAERLSYDRGQARSLTLLAIGHVMRAELDETFEALERAKTLYDTVDDPLGIAKYQWCLGSAQRAVGNFSDAIPNSYEPLAVFEAEGDQYWTGFACYSLGLIHDAFGDYERSLDYMLRAHELMKPIEEKWIHARGIVVVGAAYERLGKYKDALRWCEEGLTLFRQGGNQSGEARALTDIGRVHLGLGNEDKAIDCHLKALGIREELGHFAPQCTSLLELGRAYLRQRDTTRALDVLHRGLSIAEERAIKPRVYQLHLELSKAYELKDDVLRSLLHYKDSNRIREEIFGTTESSEIKTLETQREVAGVEREAEMARLSNVDLRQKNEQLERLLDELHAAQTQLVQSEKMAALGRLTAGITHEINTPVGVMKSQCDLIKRCVAKLRTGDPDDANRLIAMLDDSSRMTLEASERIATLVQNLKTFTQLDGAEIGPLDIHAGLDSAIALLRPEMKNGVDVVRHYGELPRLQGYVAEMNQVFMTLLRNAAQAIDEAGTITIETTTSDETVTVAIADDGKGIPPEQLEGLFDVGFTHSTARVRLGMGLATAYRVVDKHGGRIEAASAPGSGTTLTILLPAVGSSRGAN